MAFISGTKSLLTLESRIIVYTRNLILKNFRDTRSYSGHTRSPLAKRFGEKNFKFSTFWNLFITRCWRDLRLLQRGLRRAARFARLHPPPLASLAPLRGILKKAKKYFRKKIFGEEKNWSRKFLKKKNLEKKIVKIFSKIFFSIFENFFP